MVAEVDISADTSNFDWFGSSSADISSSSFGLNVEASCGDCKTVTFQF